MNKEVLNPKEVFETYVHNSEMKVSYSLRKVWFLGMMAGAFIALGAQASNVAMHSVDNVGLARLTAGAVFPIGLMMIILLGGELFTGDCLLLMGVLAKKIRIRKMISLLLTVFLSNLAGAVLISALVSFSGQWEYSNQALGAFTYRLAVSKSHISLLSAVVSGILCNILVCCAVLMSTSAFSVVGKIFAVFFSIMAFVVSGFEHCVANMYYLSAGFFASLNPAYVAKAHELYGEIGSLNLFEMLFNNLLFVTIGNIIGGFIVAAIINEVRKNK